MSEVRVNNLSNENNTGGPTISGITTYSGRHFFVPPQGDTASRPSDCEPGSLRFNTDSSKLEYFRGNTIGWTEIEAELTEPLGRDGSNSGLGVRGMIFNPSSPSGSPGFSNQIRFITISTTGADEDFGDTTAAKASCISFGGRVRAASMGGQTTPSGSSWTDDVEMVVVSSKGNSTDYATLLGNRKEGGGFSNRIRAFYIGAGYNTIEYVTISQGGNFVDFGDMSNGAEQCAAMSSPTRGVFTMNSYVPQYSTQNTIEFVEIMTTGNSTDFGDMTSARFTCGSGSNATRGIIAGGYQPSPSAGVVNTCDFLTIATTGNASDFGDLTEARYGNTGGCSSATRLVQVGGHRNPSPGTDTMDSLEFATTGNAVDFGNLATAQSGGTSTSNGHGGL